MKKLIVLLLCLLFCFGCVIDQDDLKIAECYCEEKGGIYSINNVLGHKFVYCRNGDNARIYDIKQGSLDCLKD